MRVQRVAAVLFTCLFLATGLAGCFASGNDEKVLNSHESSKPSDDAERIRFVVKDSYEEVKVFISTKGGSSSPSDCNLNYMTGQWECDSTSQDGRIRVEVRYPDDSLYDDVTVGYQATETMTIPNPRAGTWSVVLFYRNGYDGPTKVEVTAPDNAKVIFGGSFLDLLGVLLALATIVGGFYLYRKRTTFMNREVQRIDNTYTTLADDIDECRSNLLELRESLHTLLLRGKIQEGQYLILERRIEQYLNDLDTPGNRHQMFPVRPQRAMLPVESPAAHPGRATPAPSPGWEAVNPEPSIDDASAWIDLDEEDDIGSDSALRRLRDRQARD